jgi:hypothetical protein
MGQRVLFGAALWGCVLGVNAQHGAPRTQHGAPEGSKRCTNGAARMGPCNAGAGAANQAHSWWGQVQQWSATVWDGSIGDGMRMGDERSRHAGRRGAARAWIMASAAQGPKRALGERACRSSGADGSRTSAANGFRRRLSSAAAARELRAWRTNAARYVCCTPWRFAYRTLPAWPTAANRAQWRRRGKMVPEESYLRGMGTHRHVHGWRGRSARRAALAAAPGARGAAGPRVQSA